MNGALPERRPGGTVVIGYANALSAPEVAWSLRDAGYDVVALARRTTRPALRRSRSVRVAEVTAPEQDAARAVADVARVLDEAGAVAVFPLDDAALWVVHRALAGGATARLVGTADTALALDKRRQLALAGEAGLDVPATAVHDDAAAVSATGFPVVLKPAPAIVEHDGRLARPAAAVCADAAELAAAAPSIPAGVPVLVQPYIEGVGEGLFGLARDGEVLTWSAHRRVRMANPQGSGSSACVSIAVDGALAEATARMLAAARYDGLFMAEFLRDRDGTPWFMELNARPWGSMALARRCGLEYPAWAVDQALGADAAAPATAVPAGVLCRNLGLEVVHLLMVLRGPRSAAITSWPSRRRALGDVLHVRRGDTWYNADAQDRWVLAEDARQTVVGALARAVRRS
ncbi:MAG: ATP-grasp domain-containing protein [Solirubrobacterales bacterium]|nr:ATP-grasp domain-containing protein [Solirubrobacterales bacterium]